MAQIFRAHHQVALDGGVWDSAALLLPRPDPVNRPLFGGTQAELETVSAYKEALNKLERKHGEPGGKGDGKKKRSKDGGGNDE